MKSKVSELMDGELDTEDASNVIKIINKNKEWQEEWETYHLIGDVLRESSPLSVNIYSSVSQKLKTEPPIFSPNSSIDALNRLRRQKHKAFALSIAASMMVVVSTWVIINNPFYETQQIEIAENSQNKSQESSPKNVVPVMISSPPSSSNYPPVEINDYLFVHREFSLGTSMRGQTINIKNGVTEYDETYSSR